MESGAEEIFLAHEDRPVFEAGEHLHAAPRAGDDGRPDEDGAQRVGPEGGRVQVGLEAFDLGAVGVAVDGEVEDAETGLVVARDLGGQDDESGAASVDGKIVFEEIRERIEQPEADQQFADGRAFAAGKDEAVQALKLRGEAHRPPLGAALGQRGQVPLEVALKREDSDFFRH